MDDQPEDLVEGVSPQPDGERDLLVLLGAPARAVHHPEEVRLDPTHPAHAEAAAEVAVPGGEVADRRSVRLVDDDRFIVELGQDVAARSGPAGFLGEVGLGDQVHAALPLHPQARNSLRILSVSNGRHAFVDREHSVGPIPGGRLTPGLGVHQEQVVEVRPVQPDHRPCQPGDVVPVGMDVVDPTRHS